ncbi:MAG: hypothetical protein A2048_09305 [Deltaproteobacteria bacterium GWA2_45_12]|nr:MAG: hypothetical protein A2048_09305 [Deltaproteobacteria bacterium GWA2_45_12]
MFGCSIGFFPYHPPLKKGAGGFVPVSAPVPDSNISDAKMGLGKSSLRKEYGHGNKGGPKSPFVPLF